MRGLSLLNRCDLSKIKIRLSNINQKITRYVSFFPTEVDTKFQEFKMSSTITCLENFGSSYALNPKCSDLIDSWSIYAYDESVQNYKALEGDLLFCSNSVIKMEDKYRFNLTVLPYFITLMEKYKGLKEDGIYFTENIAEERNVILAKSKMDALMNCVEPKSIVLIDGPLIAGNVSAYMVNLDKKLREMDCIPLYFVKNSDSRLVIESDPKLSREFNSDFHWSACGLKPACRTPFFKYVDKHNSHYTKVFTYMKALNGFTERIEMHTDTFQKYYELIMPLMNLMCYFYTAQGDYMNPQVRPIAVAEKYAREGLKLLNIPVLMGKLGFRPTINQIRFG